MRWPPLPNQTSSPHRCEWSGDAPGKADHSGSPVFRGAGVGHHWRRLGHEPSSGYGRGRQRNSTLQSWSVAGSWLGAICPHSLYDSVDERLWGEGAHRASASAGEYDVRDPREAPFPAQKPPWAERKYPQQQKRWKNLREFPLTVCYCAVILPPNPRIYCLVSSVDRCSTFSL